VMPGGGELGQQAGHADDATSDALRRGSAA
jgi:hypothetical protein